MSIFISVLALVAIAIVGFLGFTIMCATLGLFIFSIESKFSGTEKQEKTVKDWKD